MSATTVASWIALGFAVLLFAVLSEEDRSGRTVYHGNWSWAVIPSMFTLYLSTLVDHAGITRDRIAAGGARWNAERTVVAVLMGLAVASGLFYIVDLITADVPVTMRN